MIAAVGLLVVAGGGSGGGTTGAATSKLTPPKIDKQAALGAGEGECEGEVNLVAREQARQIATERSGRTPSLRLTLTRR